MAIAGMVLGIVALVFGFIPLLGAFIAVPCIAVGLPLSGVSFYQAKKNNTSLGFPITGLATNIVAFVVVILWILLLAPAITESA